MAREPRVFSLREIEDRNVFTADMVQNAIYAAAKAYIPAGMVVNKDRSFITITSTSAGEVQVSVSLAYLKPP